MFFIHKKKIDNKIENILLSISETNESIGKLGVKVSKNGDDIQKIRQDKSLFTNELKKIQNIIETLNNGFTIPSFRNT